MENYLYALMQATSYSVGTGSQQQLADANWAILDTKIQEKEIKYWTNTVTEDATDVQKWADKLANDPNNKYYQAKLTAAQTAFQNAETEQQTFTQQADSATQAMQNQTSQDSSTMQQKVQLEAAVNQMAQAISSALSQSY